MNTSTPLTDSGLFRRERNELRERILQLQLLSEQLPVVLWTTNDKLRITSALGAGLAALRLRPHKLVGLSIYEFLNSPEMELPAITAHQRALKGSSESFDIAWKGRTFQAFVGPFHGSKTEVVGTVGIALDVTQRRKAEVALRQSEVRARALLTKLESETEERIRIEDEKRRLASIVEFSWDAILSTDLNGIIQTWNKGAEEMYGYAAQEAVGRPVSTLIPTDRTDVMPAIFQKLRNGEPFLPVQMVGCRKDASLLDVSLQVSPVRDRSGAIVGASAIARDVTAKVNAERALRRNEHELDDFFHNANVAFQWVNAEGQIIRANKASLDLLGYSENEYCGHHMASFHSDPVEAADILSRLMRGEEILNYETQLKCKDGNNKDTLINANGFWDDGKLIHFRFYTKDVTELKKAERKLRQLALHDPLTGLPNRLMFADLVRRSLLRAKSEPDYVFAVLFLDVDDLKTVNDQMGHQAGDDLLMEVGNVLRRCLRPGDVAARLAGDEFAVLLFDFESKSTVELVARRVADDLSRSERMAQIGINNTISIGGVIADGTYNDYQDIIKDADAAMYQAKEHKKGSCRIRGLPTDI